MADTPKTEEELLAEWQNMASGADAGADMGMGEVGQKILDQNEIDSLLGVNKDSGPSNRGVKALLDQSVVNYEKLPMLERVFDQFERFLSTSLRHFTADNVDVTIVSITSARFGDYLNQIPLPAGLVVVNAIGLDDYIMLVYESQLIYSVVDVLLGGRKARPVPIVGRQFTTIERRIVDNLTDIVLRDLTTSFAPVSPVQFKMERMEVNPRFALISQETNVAIVVTVRVNLEGREGQMQFCLPYATLEPIREQLLQQFMGEKFGQDNIWENHLSQELYHTSLPLSAVLDQITLPLSQALNWKVGDTIMLDARPHSPIYVDCGGVTKLIGTMGRALDYKAVKVSHNVTDLNNMKNS